jgi:hypothetical protein
MLQSFKHLVQIRLAGSARIQQILLYYEQIRDLVLEAQGWWLPTTGVAELVSQPLVPMQGERDVN